MADFIYTINNNCLEEICKEVWLLLSNKKGFLWNILMLLALKE